MIKNTLPLILCRMLSLVWTVSSQCSGHFLKQFWRALLRVSLAILPWLSLSVLLFKLLTFHDHLEKPEVTLGQSQGRYIVLFLGPCLSFRWHSGTLWLQFWSHLVKTRKNNSRTASQNGQNNTDWVCMEARGSIFRWINGNVSLITTNFLNLSIQHIFWPHFWYILCLYAFNHSFVQNIYWVLDMTTYWQCRD